MSKKLINKMFYSTFIVTLLGMLLGIIGMLIDGVFISRFYGRDSIAAYGIIFPLFITASAFAGILMSGLQAVAGKTMVQGKRQQTNACFTLTFVVGLIFSVILMLIMLIFHSNITILFGAQPESTIFNEANNYILGLSFTVPPLVLNSVLSPVNLFDGKQINVFISIVVMSVLNIVLDIINIYILNWGMFGIALATSISYWVNLIILALPLLKKNNYFRFVKDFYSKDMIKNLFLFGLPTAILRVSNAFRTFVLNLILIYFCSSASLAAFSIMTNVSNIFSTIAISGGSVMLMMVGIISGEKDKTSMWNLIKSSVIMITIISVVTGVLFYIFSYQIANLYVEGDPETNLLVVDAFEYFALSLPFFAINMLWTHYLQGIGHVGLATIFNVFDNFLYVVLFSLIFVVPYGAEAIWAGFWYGEIFVMLTIYIVTCVINRKLVCKRDDLMLLPSSYYKKNEYCVEKWINNMDEVINFSKTIYNFCKEIKLKSIFAAKLSLAIEEMCGNIIEHGFIDNKKHTIDARLIINENREAIIRIRDDCKMFDPSTYIKEYRSEDKAKNIGIHMIFKLMDDIHYANTMKMNHLVIRLSLF